MWRLLASEPGSEGTGRHSRNQEATAQDWQVNTDKLDFQSPEMVTALRPDIVLLWETSRQVVMMELTVPLEDCMMEATGKKWEARGAMTSIDFNRSWDQINHSCIIQQGCKMLYCKGQTTLWPSVPLMMMCLQCIRECMRQVSSGCYFACNHSF